MKNCFICSEDKKSFKILECSHKLCIDCYNKIININCKCPFCRTEIKINITVKKYNISYQLPKINMTRILRKCNRKKRANLTIDEYMERRLLLKKKYKLNYNDERRKKNNLLY